MKLTFDANIWVGAYDPKDLQHAVCLDVLETVSSNSGITMVSPLLMEVEVLGSIARKTHNAETINKVWEGMRSLSRQEWLPLDEQLTAEASRCATLFCLRGADAVYVATAMLNEATLLTYDEDIIKRTPQKDLTVLKPEEWLERHAKQGGA